MDKKKKIIIGSIVAIALLSVVIGFGLSSNPNNNGGNENSETATDNSNGINDTEPQVATEEKLSEEKLNELNEEPIKQANGVSKNEFENKIKELGYTLYLDKSYDYFVENESIVLVDINEENIYFCINKKQNIENEKIKQALELLIPNEIEKIYSKVNEKIEKEILILDNRTILLSINDDEINIEISI